MTPDWVDESPHRSAFAVANGIRLHYLEWGDAGPPLVMLHGIEDSPHLFDDLAPRLANDFRVVAYARRGHGDSDAPEGPYDSETFVEDLRQLLDGLRIDRTNLLGWSMGGNEITTFAGRYPDRVERLVYLDGGYDWSDVAFLEALGEVFGATEPTATDRATLDAYRTWCRADMFGETPWTPGLEAWMRDVNWIAPDGDVRPRMDDAVDAALVGSLPGWGRDYAGVRAPALLLYAGSFFPLNHPDAHKAAIFSDFEGRVMNPFRLANMERVRRELPRARLEQLANTTHMSIGVQDPAALAATIRSFLQDQAG